MPRWPYPDIYNGATCSSFGGSGVFFENPLHRVQYNFGAPTRIDKEAQEKRKRKQLKSEATAQELLKELIGVKQWEVYRKTNRVILKPNKHFWIIGDIFGNYKKEYPFNGKPDVVRIDNPNKLCCTSFCVAQGGGDDTPYTDKVVSFAVHLIEDELSFFKTGNRIGEKKFNKMKECAVWEISTGGDKDKQKPRMDA